MDLNAGDTLVISYSGFSPQTATTRTAFPVPVDILILDPANKPLLEGGGLVRNFVDVQVKTSGIHQLVFTNPGHFQALVVLVDYYLSPSTSAPTPRLSYRHPGRQYGLRITDHHPNPTTQPSTPDFGSESLFIVRQESESFQLNMVAGDLLTFTYTSYRRTTGGTTAQQLPLPPPDPVEFRLILDPLMEPLSCKRAGPVTENHVELQVEISGPHRLVFINWSSPTLLLAALSSRSPWTMPSTPRLLSCPPNYRTRPRQFAGASLLSNLVTLGCVPFLCDP